MKALLRLKPYLYPYRWLIVASTLLAIPLAALRLSPAPIIKYVIEGLERHETNKLVYFPILVIIIYFVNFIVRFAHYYLLRIVIARVNQRIKNDLHEHLLGLSADYFTAQSTGTLISRVSTDPQYIDAGLSCMNVIIREPLTFLFLFGYAIQLNWKLTLLTFGIFPPLAWVFSATGRNLKRYIARMSDENAGLFSSLQESYTGIRVIQAFRLEKYARKKYRERSERFTRFVLKTAILEEASHPMVELLTAFAIAAVIRYGGSQVLRGEMSAGELMGFFATFALMMNPLRMLNDVNIKLNQAATACNRIFEIFDWKTHLRETPNPIVARGFKTSIELDHVSFAYPDSPSRAVLKDVSFTVNKGQVLALVGPSGAGKSSLVSLLPRIFDLTSGSIRIDGIDIREYSLDSLRGLIAVVSQDIFLFNDTIEENIRCGKLSATKEEIRRAAQRAHAQEFIEAMPLGFQSTIGDRGQKLSGGERQRISIARAFLRESPILILDEATSSLDTASERAVQEALDELIRDRTTILIAHRLSTVRDADRILVIRDGQIVESGHHEELIAKGGDYAALYRAPST